jgi:hypothetical protein
MCAGTTETVSVGNAINLNSRKRLAARLGNRPSRLIRRPPSFLLKEFCSRQVDQGRWPADTRTACRRRTRNRNLYPKDGQDGFRKPNQGRNKMGHLESIIAMGALIALSFLLSAHLVSRLLLAFFVFDDALLCPGLILRLWHAGLAAMLATHILLAL